MHLDVKIRPSNKFWARHLGGYRRNLVEVQQHTAFPVMSAIRRVVTERHIYSLPIVRTCYAGKRYQNGRSEKTSKPHVNPPKRPPLTADHKTRIPILCLYCAYTTA